MRRVTARPTKRSDHQQKQVDDRGAAGPDRGGRASAGRRALPASPRSRASSALDGGVGDRVERLARKRLDVAFRDDEREPAVDLDDIADDRSLSTVIRPSPPRSSSATIRLRAARRALLRRNAQDRRAEGDDRAIEDDQRARRPALARRTRIGARPRPRCRRRGGARRGALAGTRDAAGKGNDGDQQHEPRPRDSADGPGAGPRRRERRSGRRDHEWTPARRHGSAQGARAGHARPRARPSRIRPAAWRAAAAARPPGTSPSGCRSRRRIRR